MSFLRVSPTGFSLALLGALLFLLPGSRAAAQSAAALHGSVSDAAGHPVRGAVVRIVSDPAVHANHPWRYTLIGDTLGKFSQEGLAPGAYLVLLFPGGQVSTVLRRIELHSGAVQQLDLRLPGSAAVSTSVRAALSPGHLGRVSTPAE